MIWQFSEEDRNLVIQLATGAVIAGAGGFFELVGRLAVEFARQRAAATLTSIPTDQEIEGLGGPRNATLTREHHLRAFDAADAKANGSPRVMLRSNSTTEQALPRQVLFADETGPRAWMDFRLVRIDEDASAAKGTTLVAGAFSEGTLYAVAPIMG